MLGYRTVTTVEWILYSSVEVEKTEFLNYILRYIIFSRFRRSKELTSLKN